MVTQPLEASECVQAEQVCHCLADVPRRGRFVYLSIYLSFGLSVYLSIYLSIYLSVYISIYLSTYPLSISIQRVRAVLLICTFFWHNIEFQGQGSPRRQNLAFSSAKKNLKSSFRYRQGVFCAGKNIHPASQSQKTCGLKIPQILLFLGVALSLEGGYSF